MILKLYYYAKANTMIKHNFTDDVAVCKAISKKSAINKFKKIYRDVNENNVFRLYFENDNTIAVLTDY